MNSPFYLYYLTGLIGSINLIILLTTSNKGKHLPMSLILEKQIMKKFFIKGKIIPHKTIKLWTIIAFDIYMKELARVYVDSDIRGEYGLWFKEEINVYIVCVPNFFKEWTPKTNTYKGEILVHKQNVYISLFSGVTSINSFGLTNEMDYKILNPLPLPRIVGPVKTILFKK